MSRKSDEIAFRRAALGLKVICNDVFDPPPAPPVLDGETFELRATALAKWFERQYHANVVPFHFLGDVPFNVEDLPEAAVVERALVLLRASGWQIQVQYFNSAGCRAGSVTMMHPDSVGF